jgi:amino acid transporter
MGIVVTATASIIMAVLFDLSAIASIGSAVALVVFTLVTVGHFRVRQETGAKAWLLVLANLTTVVVLVSFAVTTLAEEPGTTAALIVILLLSVVLDLVWKRRRGPVQGVGQERVPG